MDPLDTMLRQIKPQVLGWMASWHAQQGYLLPFGQFDTLASGITTTGLSPFTATVPGVALTLVSWTQSVLVATGDASNYWRIDLAVRPAAGENWIAASLYTNRMSASTWQKFSVTVNAALLATDILLYISVANVGSPGALSLAGPMVRVK